MVLSILRKVTAGLIGCLGFVVAIVYAMNFEGHAMAIPLAIGAAFVFGVLALLVWLIPRFIKKPKPAAITLSVILVLMMVIGASQRWPGGITYARFGLTVVGLLPVPALDIRIHADPDRRLGFRNKSHQITLEEVKLLLEEKPEVLIIGTGWHGVAKVDTEVRELKETRIEILKTGEALDLYEQLRAEGRRVALLAHTTC